MQHFSIGSQNTGDRAVATTKLSTTIEQPEPLETFDIGFMDELNRHSSLRPDVPQSSEASCLALPTAQERSIRSRSNLEHLQTPSTGIQHLAQSSNVIGIGNKPSRLAEITSESMFVKIRPKRASFVVDDSTWAKGGGALRISSGLVAGADIGSISTVGFNEVSIQTVTAGSMQLNGRDLQNASDMQMAKDNRGITPMLTGSVETQEQHTTPGISNILSIPYGVSSQNAQSQVVSTPYRTMTMKLIPQSSLDNRGESRILEFQPPVGPTLKDGAPVEVDSQIKPGNSSKSNLDTSDLQGGQNVAAFTENATLLSEEHHGNGLSATDANRVYVTSLSPEIMVAGNLGSNSALKTSNTVRDGMMQTPSPRIAASVRGVTDQSINPKASDPLTSPPILRDLVGVSPATLEPTSAATRITSSSIEDTAKAAKAMGSYLPTGHASTLKSTEQGTLSAEALTSIAAVKPSSYKVSQSEAPSLYALKAAHPAHTLGLNSISQTPPNPLKIDRDQIADHPVVNPILFPVTPALSTGFPLHAGPALTNPFHHMDNVTSNAHPEFTSSVRSLEASLPHNESGISIVSARLIEGKVDASMLADSMDSLTSLRPHLASLQLFMTQSGAPIKQVTIDLEGGERRSPNDDQRQNPSGSGERRTPPIDTVRKVFPTIESMNSGNVDIRV